MNKEEYRTGLWKKESSKGNTYYSGKLKIGDKEYQVSLFKNNKTNEKQPDLNIIVRDSINKQEKQVEQKTYLDDEVFKEFGESIDISESELAF